MRHQVTSLRFLVSVWDVEDAPDAVITVLEGGTRAEGDAFEDGYCYTLETTAETFAADLAAWSPVFSFLADHPESGRIQILQHAGARETTALAIIDNKALKGSITTTKADDGPAFVRLAALKNLLEAPL